MPYVCSCDTLCLACGLLIAHTDLLDLRMLLRLLQETSLSSCTHHAASDSASRLIADKHVGAPCVYQCNAALVMLYPFADHADLQVVDSAYMLRHRHSFCYAKHLDDHCTSDSDASFTACLPVALAPGAR